MINMKKFLSLLLLVGWTSGCGFFQEGEAFGGTTGEPKYSGETPIQLKVSKIEVISEFSPSFKRPNVEHLFPTNIEKTARTWARDRLEAVEPSSDKTATFIVRDASVVESDDPAQKAFYKDRTKYRATLNVVLRITDSKNLSRAETEIQAWRELIIPVDTPIETKEGYWNDMVKKLFDEFDPRMTQNINQYLNIYVKGNSRITEY